jgi:8-amino-7-oxononanoate synthase
VGVLDFLTGELAALEQRALLRVRDDGAARARAAAAAAALGRRLLDLSSNDYLGLGQRDVSRETSPGLGAASWPAGDVSRETLLRLPPTTGAGSSRLIHGTRPEHVELERLAAEWVGQPSSLLFSSGYAANVSTIAALVSAGDLIFSDELNHASIVDGCRLSRATVHVIPHLDASKLAHELQRRDGRRRLVVVESYYSMDGDGPDLSELREICDHHDAILYVDEAHALGVFGPGGAGRARAAGIAPDVLVGTFGKSVGTHGAFVAGSADLCAWLWNRARGFVFSTAPSPFLTRVTTHQLLAVQRASEQRARLAELSTALRARLPTPSTGFGPIVPCRVSSAPQALAVADALAARGILVQAIRPPTVPPDTSRLRMTVTAQHNAEEIQYAAAALTECLTGPAATGAQ